MVKVQGCQLNVIDRGNGPPVLLLHGNPDSSQLWAGVITHLSDSFRCIAPDLPGFGLSTAPSDFDFSLGGQADFVQAMVRALGIDQPLNVVAHDFGGTFALAWMSRFPAQVHRLAVTNTAFFSDYQWHFWAHVWRIPLLGELSTLTMNRRTFRRELRRGSSQLSTRQIDATYELLTPAVKRTVLRLYRTIRPSSFLGWEQRYLAAAEHIPVLVLWGDDDPYIPTQYADRFKAKRIVHYPGAGHWLPAVEPVRVAEELRTHFLQQ